ncbi:putative 50S ribosomal protein L7/L12 [Iris pallida]|uniref:50S ribosomal protein L7/L12 n=1 Tax=Iris pallida TaxID=29817 RepID=A0AAX6FB49_IRIPA|nr:putative 50S ribosomal protein L7/L12 [Iris pallida]
MTMRPPLSLLRLLALRNPSSSIPHHPPSFSSAPFPPPTTDRVSSIVDEISSLTLLEVADLTEALRRRLGVEQMPVLAVMSPGMGFPGAAGAGGKAAEQPAAEEEKKEKTAFDVKLEGFEAAAKIKIIKEVRTFTDLGLKEAKELVEKAPVVLKQGMPKEEAEKIAAKLKEIGAKVVLE